MRITITNFLVLFFFFWFFTSKITPVFAGNPPDFIHSSLTASPQSVPADGSTTSTLTITLRDSSNTPINGDSITITAPSDTTAVITPSSTTVNSSGVATVTITSTQAGADAITVTDTTTSTTLTGLGQVDFNAVTTPTPTTSSTTSSSSSNSDSNGPPSCTNTPPAAPNLYAVYSTRTTATLYFTQPSSQFDGYTISYGLTESADSYNVTFPQVSLPGANKYTINKLISNGKYYFKVRANSGCATGIWSAVKTSSGKAPTLPATGPVNIITIGLAGVAIFLAGFGVLFAL